MFMAVKDCNHYTLEQQTIYFINLAARAEQKLAAATEPQLVARKLICIHKNNLAATKRQLVAATEPQLVARAEQELAAAT
ncbi:hypothetical protein DPMN_120315 [Dreissena polymorpha]|uniref:Uncharacterized protein n=1 Tax=Dreissena polymorpha TaxID=45954 RepID=A0A9D4GN26_DREPO|nr:hypothetical protein DPMN_120315 [Dreissena polymorpha]